MKNLRINKEKIVSLLLAGSIALSVHGCSRQLKEKQNEEPQQTPLPISDEITYDKDTLFYHRLLCNYNYEPVFGNQEFVLSYGDSIYFVEDEIITNKFITSDELKVTLESSQYDYAFVTLPNGEKCYVDIHSLKMVDSDNIRFGDYIVTEENKDVVVKSNTYLYDYNGMVIKCLCVDQPCHIVAKSEEYALITLPDGSEGFTLNSALVSNYQRIDGYTFVNKGTMLYCDNTFTQPAYTVSDDVQMLYVDFINQEYAAVFDWSGREVMYIRLSDLRENFIFENLADQKLYCFKDFHLAAVFPTRSGKLSTPTHEGVFAITEKVEDFWFTKYAGCHAKHWIVYNENDEEGIHDLEGDDEQNYGNQAYQLDGSHGCIRVPADASAFVYENYDIGDMVIVAHDGNMLIYNVAKNEIGIYDADSYTRTRSK